MTINDGSNLLNLSPSFFSAQIEPEILDVADVGVDTLILYYYKFFKIYTTVDHIGIYNH